MRTLRDLTLIAFGMLALAYFIIAMTIGYDCINEVQAASEGHSRCGTPHGESVPSAFR